MAIKVIYLDDEADLCEIFQESFATPDIQIQTFTDSKLAIEASKLAKFDVAFIDYRLPGLKGDEVASQMPDSPNKYLLTGESDPKPNFKFKSILPKPFDYAAIEGILSSHLKGH
jgi:DNA-binding response OmpR family regulator